MGSGFAFRVFFHEFQTIFDWKKTEPSVATGTNAIKLRLKIPKPSRFEVV